MCTHKSKSLSNYSLNTFYNSFKNDWLLFILNGISVKKINNKLSKNRLYWSCWCVFKKWKYKSIVNWNNEYDDNDYYVSLIAAELNLLFSKIIKAKNDKFYYVQNNL